MERFGWRGFGEIFVAGILLLTAGYFAVREHTVTTEYHEYRDGIFARAYESVMEGLGHYAETGDIQSAARLADRFAELPLSEEEIGTVRQFLSDLTAGPSDSGAKTRADAYAALLLRYLSTVRERAYTKSWRAAGLGLPQYPEVSVATGWHPKEETETDGTAEAAEAILGRRFVCYTRREESGITVGYRSASGYAEYRDGCLVRALVYRTVGEAELSEEALCEAAERLLLAQGYPSAEAVGCERRHQTVFVTVRQAEDTFSVGLTKDTGLLRSFRKEAETP